MSLSAREADPMLGSLREGISNEGQCWSSEVNMRWQGYPVSRPVGTVPSGNLNGPQSWRDRRKRWVTRAPKAELLSRSWGHRQGDCLELGSQRTWSHRLGQIEWGTKTLASAKLLPSTLLPRFSIGQMEPETSLQSSFGNLVCKDLSLLIQRRSG